MGLAHAQSPHGRIPDYRYPTAARDCEACHGPGSAHAASGDPADIYGFDPLAGEPAYAACMSCHEGGMTRDWHHSPHAAADVSCGACHSIHASPDGKALLATGETEVCYSCHFDQKARFQLPSHHPVKEGFMTCSDCHNPHSADFSGLVTGETSRDLCLTCHTQYHGPFIFEHSPVEEDCAICHGAHGAVANNLLHQNEPFLCLQCHQPHFHAGLLAVEGPFSPPDAVIEGSEDYAGLQGFSHADGMKRVMLTKCTQCHQAIHGSDLPSQSIPGQGRALNR
jgi:DmsE family decaheme c-type cytochrome